MTRAENIVFPGCWVKNKNIRKRKQKNKTSFREDILLRGKSVQIIGAKMCPNLAQSVALFCRKKHAASVITFVNQKLSPELSLLSAKTSCRKPRFCRFLRQKFRIAFRKWSLQGISGANVHFFGVENNLNLQIRKSYV